MKYMLAGLVIKSSTQLLLPEINQEDVKIDFILEEDRNLLIPKNTKIIFENKDIIIIEDDRANLYFLLCDEIIFKINTDASYVIFKKPKDISSNIITINLATFVITYIHAIHNIPVLHASAVIKDDFCIAFMAPSNSGKSTLAAYFVERGYQLVSDELVPLYYMNGRICTVPYNLGLKLRNESVEFFSNICSDRVVVNKANRKEHITHEILGINYIPLNCIYLINSQEDLVGSNLVGQNKKQSIELLIKNMYGVDFIKINLFQKLLGQLSIINSKINISEITYKKSFDQLEVVYKLVDAQLSVM